MKNIMLHEPNFFREEVNYLKKCISTKWVSTGGDYVLKFEKSIKNFTNAKHAVALNSGTAALDLTLKLIQIKQNDEIIVPSVTFIAPINCVLYQNASPIFMDCDENFNIDVKKTVEFIKRETIFRNGFTLNKKTKKRIKAIIIVHVFGNVADTIKLKKICNERRIKIIEDASESLGSFYKNKIHTGLIGDIGCLSFNANKIITTGAGGMIITNNKKYADRAKYLSTQAKDDPFYFKHNDIGYNSRLNNLNAAVGYAQMQKIKKILSKKIDNHKQYKKEIINLKNFKLLSRNNKNKENYWLNILLFTDKVDREKLIKKLKINKIDTRPVWHPNHLQLKMKKFQTYKITRSSKLLKKALCLPSGYDLNLKKIKRIVTVLKNFN